MQPLGLTGPQQTAYLKRLFGSHDYRVDVEILNLNEQIIGTAQILDGQVNLQTDDGSGGGVRRTATLTVSDPTGALDFTGASAWSGSTVWVDRLIRITHTLKVPGVGIRGNAVTATVFIGPPSTISRQGAEVSVEAQDKTALANRGASPYTAAKGTNAVTAIRNILAERTGEFRFRLGTTTRRLSKPYSVGWDDTTSPWAIAAAIARTELGMQLIYSCDGYATLRRTPTTVALTVPYVTDQAASQVDFTALSNWVRVQGKVATKTTKTVSGNTTTTVTTTAQPQAIAQVTSGSLSPGSLARKGVRRYLPLLIQEDAYTTTADVTARANAELTMGARTDSAPQFTCVPFFHADVDDIVHFAVPGNDVNARLASVSIPLGADEMTIGAIRWVSFAPRRGTAATTLRSRKVSRVTKKPAKKKKGK